MAVRTNTKTALLMWNDIKIHKTIPKRLIAETAEDLLKNVKEIDFDTSPVRLKNHDLNRSIYECGNVIPFAQLILDDVTRILGDEIIVGLVNKEGSLVCSGNQSKLGLCCHDTISYINNEYNEFMTKGNAVQVNLGQGAQSGGVAILDNDGFIRYYLIARNDAGPLTIYIWNILYLVAQLIQQQYYTLQLLEENTSSFMDLITDPALVLNDKVKVIYANESCLRLLDVDNSNLGDELYNISFIADYRHLKNIRSVLTSKSITVKTRKRLITCVIKNQQLIDTAYGKRLAIVIDQAQSTCSLWRPEYDLCACTSSFNNIIGEALSIQRIKSLAQQIAKTQSTILLEGDTGTGKELLAEAIHIESERKGKFIAVNCGGIPSELMQSELFGYEEGAFTGAKKGGKLGQIELADEGTLFLDEIGEMPIEMQVSLLRFLQNKTITRIGGEVTKTVDVRVIAATNRNLKNEVDSGNFREDLYYRLNVIHFRLPALKDRKEDIPLIANYLLGKLCKQYDIPLMQINMSDRNYLLNYDFPGNIRELANVIERAFLLKQGEKLFWGNTVQEVIESNIQDRSETLDNTEKQLIEQYLRIYKGQVSLTADALNITRMTLYRKMKKLNINRDDFLKS